MKRQKDNRMRFTCPVEGLDYPLYSKEEDKAVRLEDFAYLCLKPEVLEAHSMCFQPSFYEKAAVTGEEEQEPEMPISFGLLPGSPS